MRCNRPGSPIGGRFAASRLIAAANESWVAWSGSKWTVTLAYPATVWRTSRLFFRAVASAIARVLSAVSSRVPSSASSAASPSGWIRNLGVERGAGMGAHKDGVEDAGHDAGAENPDAGNPYRPRCDDGGGGEIPRREVASHTSDRRRKVEQVDRPSAGGKAHRGMRNHEQHDEAPGQSQDEGGGHAGVDLRHRSVAGVPHVSLVNQGRQRAPRERKRRRDQHQGDGDPEAFREKTDGKPPARKPAGWISGRRASGFHCVAEQRHEGDWQQRDHEHANQPPGSPFAAKRPGERGGDRVHKPTLNWARSRNAPL